MSTEGYRDHYAVADAMMFVQEEYLENGDYVQKLSTKIDSRDFTEILDEILISQSKSKCSDGSRMVITYLHKNYPQWFNYLFSMTLDMRMVPGMNENNGKDEPRVGEFKFHTVFMAQSIENVWFAGSPANFDPESRINFMTDIMTSESLEGIVEKIDAKTPGPWPTADIIAEKLEEYHEPVISPNLKNALFYCHLQRLKGVDFFEHTSRLRPVGPDQYYFSNLS